MTSSVNVVDYQRVRSARSTSAFANYVGGWAPLLFVEDGRQFESTLTLVTDNYVRGSCARTVMWHCELILANYVRGIPALLWPVFVIRSYCSCDSSVVGRPSVALLVLRPTTVLADCFTIAGLGIPLPLQHPSSPGRFSFSFRSTFRRLSFCGLRYIVISLLLNYLGPK